ncbi:MAG: CmcI family methyltransferase [Pelagibacteraceae bacterium]
MIDIKDRFFDSFIFSIENSSDWRQNVKKSKWNKQKWKGLTLMKDPMTLSTIQCIINDLKPKTIIEFGTYDGGSALWMHDILKNFQDDFTIHTFDIVDYKTVFPKRINFHQFDNYQIDSFNVELLKNMIHPVLFIEDSHKNFIELLNLIDPFVTEEDFLIVEDTIVKSKHDKMVEWLKDKKYKVNDYYCDMWGYNGSWNFNGYLQKMR